MTILSTVRFAKNSLPTQAIHDRLLLGYEFFEVLLLLFCELLVIIHCLLSLLLVLASADLFARLYIQLDKFLETIEIKCCHVLLVTRQTSLQVALVAIKLLLFGNLFSKFPDTFIDKFSFSKKFIAERFTV